MTPPDPQHSPTSLAVAEIRQRLADRPIELVEYGGSMAAPSSWHCLACGHRWRVAARKVAPLSTVPTGCPHCARPSVYPLVLDLDVGPVAPPEPAPPSVDEVLSAAAADAAVRSTRPALSRAERTEWARRSLDLGDVIEA